MLGVRLRFDGSAVLIVAAAMTACGDDVPADMTSTSGGADVSGTSVGSISSSEGTATSVDTSVGDATSTGEPPGSACEPIARAWTWTPVTDDCNVEGGSALAIAADGSHHIVFLRGSYDTGSQTLHYASDASGAFAVETVDPELSRFVAPQIALDVTGGIHVLVDRITDSELRYAAPARGGWAVEVVTGVGVGGSLPRLALTDSGPLVAFRGTGVLVTTRDGDPGVWSMPAVAVDPLPDALALAVAADGTRWIAFGVGGQAHIAADDGSGWTERVLTDGTPRALAVAQDGVPHVVIERSTGAGAELVLLRDDGSDAPPVDVIDVIDGELTFTGVQLRLGAGGGTFVLYAEDHVILDDCGLVLARRDGADEAFTRVGIHEAAGSAGFALAASDAPRVALCTADGLVLGQP